MSSVAIATPGGLQAALITGGKLGTTGTDFYIKVMRWHIPWQFGLQKTTGDGDSANCDAWDINYMMDFGIVLDGLMVASAGNGFLITNFFNTSKNPMTTSARFFFTTNQILTFSKSVIHAGSLTSARDGVSVRTVLHIKASDTVPTWASS